MEIPNIDLGEWADTLKPYQRELVLTLVEKYGEEGAIQHWLAANGPGDIARFGGIGKTSEPFMERFKQEFDKFICGHPDYQEDQKQFDQQGQNTKKVLVSAISGAIGAKLGIVGTIIAPVVVISLFTIGKIGRNAYCAGKF
jgi:hypothetical protein